MHNWDYKFDPPTVHEIDECQSCHNEGYHTDIVEWDLVCGDCEAQLDEAIENGEYCQKHKLWYCEEVEHDVGRSSSDNN